MTDAGFQEAGSCMADRNFCTFSKKVLALLQQFRSHVGREGQGPLRLDLGLRISAPGAFVLLGREAARDGRVLSLASSRLTAS